MSAAEQFRDAIAAAGLRPPDDVIADGKLHRFSTNGRASDDSGWYMFHGDGLPAGQFGDWRTGVSETWRADVGRRLTPAEKAAYRTRLEEIRRAREADEIRRHAEARQEAAAIWNAATPAGDEHPYLTRKQVHVYGLRVHTDGRLIVPVRDNHELHSLQYIDADGDKLFLAGGRVKGCYHAIGTLDGAVALCIAEGYATGATVHVATGYPVAVAFNAGNLLAVAKAMRAQHPEMRLILCADDDIGTKGNPGLTKATEAARAVGGWLVVPLFGADRPAKATDFNDVRIHRGVDAVAEAIMHAGPATETGTEDPPADSTTTLTDVVSELLAQSGLSKLTDAPQPVAVEAALRALADVLKDADPLRRAVVRNAAVDLLKARKVPSPVALVNAALGTVTPTDTATGQGTALTLADPEAWPHAVDGAGLLGEIRDSFTRYIVLPQHAAMALALWVVHTHAIETAYVSPILAITSPQKRCGKTTVLELLGCMVRRPLPASNVSAAALFRAVEAYGPTLLVDEADTFLAEHEELRGILNSGHTRTSAQVVRTVGDDHEPRVFRTFGAKAIAAIGALPGTIEDRAVIVRMQRRAAGEDVERIRRDRIERDLLPLRRRAARWIADYVEELRTADPSTPSSLHDRAADNWRPLLAIADATGGEWPALARSAAVALSPSDDDDSAAGVMVLADLRNIYDARAAERLSSAVIVEHLVTLTERPWPEWRRGKPLTPNGLARLLKPFGVHPETVRIGDDTPKGYKRADLEEAWVRYLSPGASAPNRNNATTPAAQGPETISQPQQRQAVLHFDGERKPLGDNDCGGVADGKPDVPERDVLDL